MTDSRGFAYKQTGTVAGDLGGQFTIRLDSAPFTHNGKTIRVKSVHAVAVAAELPHADHDCCG